MILIHLLPPSDCDDVSPLPIEATCTLCEFMLDEDICPPEQGSPHLCPYINSLSFRLLSPQAPFSGKPEYSQYLNTYSPATSHGPREPCPREADSPPSTRLDRVSPAVRRTMPGVATVHRLWRIKTQMEPDLQRPQQQLRFTTPSSARVSLNLVRMESTRRRSERSFTMPAKARVSSNTKRNGTRRCLSKYRSQAWTTNVVGLAHAENRGASEAQG